MNILIIGNEDQFKGYCLRVGITPNITLEFPFAVNLDTNRFGLLTPLVIGATKLYLYDQWIKEVNKSNADTIRKETVVFVDGSCSGNPGKGQCRGKLVDGTQIFLKSTSYTTNNVMEYFAVASAIDWAKENNKLDGLVIYSDSKTAQSWVRKGNYKSSAKDSFNLGILSWSRGIISYHKGQFELRDWDTKSLGEIPADFGNKK